MRKRSPNWQKGCSDTMEPSVPCSSSSGCTCVRASGMEKPGGERMSAVFLSFFFLIHRYKRNDRTRLACPSSTLADTGSRGHHSAAGRATSCRILVLSNNHAMRYHPINSNDYARTCGNPGIVVKKGVSTFAAARHFFLERVVIGKQKKVKHCGARPM